MKHDKPYVDSFWGTKKRQIPFIIDNVCVVWETSYGMTVKNPGLHSSDMLRKAVDDAIERAFITEMEEYLNNGTVSKIIEYAHRENEKLDNDTEIINLEVTSQNMDEISEGKTLEDLISEGKITKGIQYTQENS